MTLPPTCRALVCSGTGPLLQLKNVPTPEAIPGSVIIRVLAAAVESQLRHNLSGKQYGLTIPTPFIPGNKAIGRVAATGPDTTSLKVGQLVVTDSFVRARDDPNVQILWGMGIFGNDPGAKKLMEDSWRDGMYTEYARAPLENTYPLNEKLLLGSPAEGGLGYSLADLTTISKNAVAYGGFRGIDLKAGETIIISPATGGFSGGAVEVASAMGARVIAVGRNLEKLQAIAAVNERVSIVHLRDNYEEDLAALQKFGVIDAYLDISPAIANDSTHVRSCMMAVKPYGRVSLMGVIQKDIAIPYMMAVLKNLTIRGQYMYEREDVRGLIKLVEAGVYKLGKAAGHELLGEYSLEKWEEALETAEMKGQGSGKITIFTP